MPSTPSPSNALRVGVPGGAVGAGRLASVDALRFLAAALVMFGHTAIPWQTLPIWTRPLSWVAASGGTGVSLFLVLSGFSITMRWASRDHARAFPVRAFWWRRFLRLYPTFWLAAVLNLVVLGLLHGWTLLEQPQAWGWVRGSMPTWVQVLSYAVVVTANVIPLVYMGRAWSLALEEQIYALYTLLQVRLPQLRPMRLLVWALAVQYAWSVLIIVVHPGFGSISTGPIDKREVFLGFQVPALLTCWIAGWVIAEARARGVRLPTWAHSSSLGLSLLAVGVLLRAWGGPVLALPGGRECAPVDLFLSTIFAAGFSILVASLVLPCDDRIKSSAAFVRVERALAAAGLWSYSLYLLHPTALDWIGTSVHLPLLPQTLLSWAAGLALSYAFWLLVERRWVQRSQRAPHG